MGYSNYFTILFGTYNYACLMVYDTVCRTINVQINMAVNGLACHINVSASYAQIS